MSTFSIFPIVFAIVFALFVGPTQSSDNTAAITQMLDDLEQIVKVYEKYGEKDPFCMQYTVIINGDILPKITSISEQMQKFSGGKSFSPVLAERHSDIRLRFSKAMMKVMDSLGRMEMCVPDENKNCPTGLTNTNGFCSWE